MLAIVLVLQGECADCFVHGGRGGGRVGRSLFNFATTNIRHAIV